MNRLNKPKPVEVAVVLFKCLFCFFISVEQRDFFSTFSFDKQRINPNI